MLKNYLKIAWRNLLKNRMFSFINIMGLAIGISCCVLIYLYVQNELSYDRYNEKADRIYRVTSYIRKQSKEETFVPTSPIMSRRIKENFPEVENAVRFQFSSRQLSYDNRKFPEARMTYADSTVFEVFTFPLIAGDPITALKEPYSVVLSETAVKRYFGNADAFGKTMKLSDTINLKVTGIMKDIPRTSHFTFDCAISRSTIGEMARGDTNWVQNDELNWFNCDSYSYLLLKENADPKALQSKVNTLFDKEQLDIKKSYGMWMNAQLQPLTDIHLKSELEHEIKGSEKGDIMYVYIFSATAILILLIACCNFINLSTARSLNRSKEIGLRKVIGAMRGQLIAQFLGESVLFSLIASILSIVFVILAIPLFNSFLATELSLNLSVLWIYLLIIASVGFLSGLYPALLMSSFAPIKSLKGKISHGFADLLFRKGLVVFQFSIAIILIIGTTLILNQLSFIQNAKIGMNKEQLVGITMKGSDREKADVFIKELTRNPKVVAATLNGFNFKGISNITMWPEGFAENEMTSSNVFAVDENFLKVMQIDLAAGRDFSKDFPTDVTEAFIVNEAAVKEFNWKSPKEALGKKIDWGGGKKGKVIGVTKDFNYASLHDEVEPLVIHIFPQWYKFITLRLKTDNLVATMKDIETSWKKISTSGGFEYAFLEDDFNSLYQAEQNMRSVLSAFTLLAVLVACLGLFGLAAFTIKQRFREIGIRKVLGSSSRDIVRLLSKDFLKLVLISIVIASPVAWYGGYKWLQDFAYKANISWWIFIIAGGLALVIAFVTVAFQALRAANANPVKSLRTE
ncbi:MAG: FtsX-like permease family protein [Bacteroidetes bacterium]|nr:FtsX-like permease family protein [Bacteroidota bacterium]